MSKYKIINLKKKLSVESIRNVKNFYLGNFLEVENGVPAAAVILLLQVKNCLQNYVYNYNIGNFLKLLGRILILINNNKYIHFNYN